MKDTRTETKESDRIIRSLQNSWQNLPRGSAKDITHNFERVYTALGKAFLDEILLFRYIAGDDPKIAEDIKACRGTKFGVVGSVVGGLGLIATGGLFAYGLIGTIEAIASH